MSPPYRFMPLWRSDEHPERCLVWQDGDHPWTATWKTTVNQARLLEPRWVKGRLLWLYSGLDHPIGFRWLIEILDNGEEDLQLKQAMHAARWVEKHRTPKGKAP